MSYIEGLRFQQETSLMGRIIEPTRQGVKRYIHEFVNIVNARMAT